MNEEFKIQVKAVVDDALSKLNKINEQLEDIGEESQKASKKMKDSMQSAARSAQLQVEAIKQVVSALINLGKNSIEAQKSLGRLNSSFQSAGRSATEASETYRKIFGFLGDSDAAVEAAQQLANIPTDNLKEYEQILQGVYATFGTSIETGGLAEGINHTIALGSVQGTLADAYEFLGINIDDVNGKLASLNSESEREAFIRSSLTGLYGEAANIYGQNNAALISYNQSQANLNIAMAQAGQAITPLLTAFNNLSAMLLTSFKPALEIVASALLLVVQIVGTALKWVSAFFSLFSKGGNDAANASKGIATGISSAATGAKAATGGVGGLNKALNGAAKAAKELKKQTMGFDELNVLQSQSSADGGAGADAASIPSGGGAGVSIPTFEMPDTSAFSTSMDEIKGKIEAIGVLVGLAGAAFLTWKIIDIVSDAEKLSGIIEIIKTKAAGFGGTLMIIAGAVLLVQGYCDAWVNGIDWGNFAAILGGLALIVGGLALAVSPLAAGIAAIAGGIALVIIGIKDFVENGYSMQNVLTILAGVIAVVVGVCLAFNAALLANPITWIVIAIAALVAAFVILWNECEGFRNFWIGLWEGIKTLFGAFVDWIKPMITSIGEFFSGLWEGIKTSLSPLAEAIGNAFKQAWELIKVVWELVKPYFETLWNNIKVVFSVVKDVLGAYFKAAWEVIKIVWDVVVSYFSTLWTSITEVFSVVKTFFEGMFKAAWEAIKFVWDVVIGYFTTIWNTIAGVFSVVKNVLTGNWKDAWEGIKGIVNTWQEYFSGIWEGIKNVFGVVKEWFSNTFSAAWTAIKNIFNSWGTFFSGLWDGVKKAFGTVKEWLSSTFSAAWTGIKNIFSNWGSFFSGLWDTIKNTFSSLGTKLGSAIGDAVKSGINGVLSMIESTINKGINLLNGAVDLINKIPGVNIGKFQKINLPRLARGGVVDSATIAMIGEQGKEAVVPLENNTEWIDKLADRLAAKSNTPSKIVLTLDGKELGWANIRSINNITKQTGSLPLKIV